ncbi:MAG: NTP transferase domain-containing protein [Theionarchaea archaeon]|nr:NTP transferase domain-containing protein [Theionarchaea archaeon]
MKVVILSGGFATRLRPLTNERAKPLLPIAGEPLIEYVFEKYDISEKPFVTTNEKFLPQFTEWIETYERDVHLIIEETRSEEEKLGAIGALANFVTTQDIADDLLVVAGDNIFPFSLSEFVDAFCGNPLIALFDFQDKERVRNKYGVVTTDEEGNVLKFQEKPAHPSSTLVSIGCYVFPRETLSLMKEFVSQIPRGKDAPGYFMEWLSKHTDMNSFVCTGKWYDIGDRQSYIEANLDLSHSKNYLADAVTLDETTLHHSVVFPHVSLKNCTLTECIVDSHVILENVTLKECIIGAHTDIRRIV